MKAGPLKPLSHTLPRMEPSLRSSSYRPTECKVRRTDPALHETIQRFVESLSNDVRVSQYADLNHAVKRLENSKWYWLAPSGRSGYLVFLPKTPIVWIDEQFKTSYKIQMRVSSAVYNETSVMIASLNLGDAILRLEDVWVLAGETTKLFPFTQRWNMLQEFYAIQYKADSVLQQGLRIEPAEYQSLESIKKLQTLPNTMIAQGEDEKRRLRVQLVAGTNTSAHPTHVTPATPVSRKEVRPMGILDAHWSDRLTGQKTGNMPVLIAHQSKTVSNKDGEAIAVAHPEYPDTYELTVNGVKKGFAAVQDMELSKRLRLVKGEIRVKIEWSPEFSMYEIHDIL